MAYGINIKEKRDKSAAQLRQEMVGPHCPFCHRVNVAGTQLCTSCHRPISTVSYDTIIKEAENTKQRLQLVENTLASIQQKHGGMLNEMEAAYEMWQELKKEKEKEDEKLKAAGVVTTEKSTKLAYIRALEKILGASRAASSIECDGIAAKELKKELQQH
jgi:hypothetical protein